MVAVMMLRSIDIKRRHAPQLRQAWISSQMLQLCPWSVPCMA